MNTPTPLLAMGKIVIVSAFLFGTHAVLATSDTVCLQKIQSAVSPEGICQEFPTPCDVPTDWKSIPNCDLVENKKAKNSLVERMLKRLDSLHKEAEGLLDSTERMLKQDSPPSTIKKSKIPASGTYTRTIERHKRLPTATDSVSTKGMKAFTEKNFSKDGLLTRKNYNHKGGFERSDDTTKTERMERQTARPAFMSTTEMNRTGTLKSTLKWDTEQKSHMSSKKYEKNPYRFESQYKTEKVDKTVDIQERMMSRNRKFRGERLDGAIINDK